MRSYGHCMLNQQKRTVLIVDDERSVLELLRLVLMQEGYTVVTAPTGQEGLAALVKHAASVDIFICDLCLPDMQPPSWSGPPVAQAQQFQY